MSAQPAPKKDDKKPDATKQADAAKAAPPKDPKKADSQTDMNAQPTQYQGVHSFLAHGSKFIVDTKYAPLKPLGRGAYGVVVSCLDKSSNKKVAIKKIPKAFDDLVDAKRILREVKLLRHFKHENIVGLRDFIPPPTDTESLEDIYMVLDFMETDLHKIIYSRNELTDEHIQYFVYQMLRALKYIHSAHVIHRDLKPSNLLLNGNCDLKICDFGLARGVKEEEDYELTEYVVTRWYRAPEVMCSCQEYDHKIDVWSVGCILGELHGRKPLFPGDDYIKQMNLIFNVLGTPTKQDMAFITNDKASDYIKSLEKRPKVPFSKIYPDANPLALDLLDKMLTFSPHKRISIEEALKHPYLAGLHNPKKEFECKDRFDFDFEKIEMTKEILQDFMWEEIYLFRAERRIKGQPKKTDKWFAMAEQKRKAKEEAKKKRMTNTGTGTGGKRSTADKKDSGILAAVQANQAQAAGVPNGPSGGVATSQPKSNTAAAPGSSSQPLQQRP